MCIGPPLRQIGSDFNRDLAFGISPSGFVRPAPRLNDERAYEVNYKVQVFPWFVLQPVYQFYANVGGRQHGSAALAGLRLITTF